MVVYEVQAWRPTRYVDHLCCVRGRNLTDDEDDLPASAWYFQLSIPQRGLDISDRSEECPQQWNSIYTSEQVQATRNPDWTSFIWEASSAKQAALLREVSIIQICVYANKQHPSHAHRPTPGHIPYRHNKGIVRAPATTHALSSQQISTPTPGTVSQQVPAEHQKADCTDSDSPDTPQPQAPAFTAEVNLNDLVAVQGTLAALDVCLPQNTLVLELKEGFCLFPSLESQSDSLQLPADSQQATSIAPMTDQGTPLAEPGQKERQQLVQSLLQGPSRPATPKSGGPEVVPPDQPSQTPEGSRLKGLVKAKLGFAFGNGPELAGMGTPAGRTPEQYARLASSQHASTSGRSTKVDMGELDAQMVRLARKQRAYHKILSQKEELQEQLTEALQLRNTARQQSLKLDALRHARERQHAYASHCSELKAGIARRQQLACTILNAQLQSLHHALTVLKGAYGRLGSADLLLKGPEGALRYRPLHAHLVGRGCRMATLLGSIFRLGPQTVTVCQAPPGGFLEDQLERGWWAASDAGSNASSNGSPRAVVVSRGKQAAASQQNGFRQMAMLSVGGLDLDPLLGRGGLEGLMNWEPDRQEMRKAAAALGYTALIVNRLAVYLDVPLRFPIRPGSCKTVILSHFTCAGTYRSVPDGRPAVIRRSSHNIQTAFKRDVHGGITEFPLYCEGVDRTRFAYGIYLLNKDVEQILNVHGLTATGASQVLANLHKLLAAAASA